MHHLMLRDGSLDLVELLADRQRIVESRAGQGTAACVTIVLDFATPSSKIRQQLVDGLLVPAYVPGFVSECG